MSQDSWDWINQKLETMRKTMPGAHRGMVVEWMIGVVKKTGQEPKLS